MAKIQAAATNHFFLILCGGTGPRLWPLSRRSLPKQFLKITDHESLLNQTIKRLLKYSSPDNIFLVSNEKYLNRLRKETRSLIPGANILTEPDKKNTAMAIIFGTSVVASRHPDAVITTLPSDHFIKNINQFHNNLSSAYKLALSTHSIITIGINPSFPNPSFGYIQPAKSYTGFSSVKKFIEKPKVEIAAKMIKSGALWNTGMYTFTPQSLLSEFEKHEKSYLPIYKSLIMDNPDPEIVRHLYSLSPELPIDKAISEKSTNLLVIPAGFDWSDIGEWRSIFQILHKDADNQALLNLDTNYLSINSSGCLLNGNKKKLIGLIGVKNLAVIDTDDALLICNLNDSFLVRDLVAKIVSKKSLEKYFLK